jgi:SAM-dependent methyltransferase
MSAFRRAGSGSGSATPPARAILRLIEVVVLGRWRITAEHLYREVARIIEAAGGQDVLVSGCGDGLTVEWLAARTKASVVGVDADRKQIERAEARVRGPLAVRGGGTPADVSFQQAPLDDLPHEDGVFDAVVGEPAIAAASDPSRAVAELVRVARPMGVVVLLELTWGSELSAAERELLVERLGLRPRLLVEWKRMLRDAGVVDIQVQDWTAGEPGGESTAGAARDAVDAARLTWTQKLQIAARAWWMLDGGWRAARAAVEREMALLRELSDERAIGFQLIKGVKWPHRRPERPSGPAQTPRRE